MEGIGLSVFLKSLVVLSLFPELSTFFREVLGSLCLFVRVLSGLSLFGVLCGIGVAFENRDGSLNLKLNFLPTELAGVTLQVRDRSEKADQDAA